MKQYILDPQALLGGIIAQDDDQELVQLALQKDNEIPPYQSEAIILLIILNGRAQIRTEQAEIETHGLQVVRIEANETHSIRALENNTTILVVKQLTHTLTFSKKLRFGSCCL